MTKGDLMVVEDINYPNWVTIPDDLEFYETCVGEIATDIGWMAREVSLPHVWADKRRRTELVRQVRAAVRALAYAEAGKSVYRAQKSGLVFYGIES